MDFFTEIPLTKKYMHIYHIRTSILKSLTKTLPEFKGCLLDAGCGKMPYKEYIFENSKIEKYVGLDIENAFIYDKAVRPDFEWDGVTMPFEANSFETVIATEVLEHCPNPSIYLKEINRVLKKDGVFFFTVPFLWPLHDLPRDEYRYTPYSLERLLKEAGFSDIEINPLGGYHASLATVIGLWFNRYMPKNIKVNLLKTLIFPFYKWLLKNDKPPVKYREDSMVTGFYGIIRK